MSIFSGKCADIEIVPGKIIGNTYPCFIIAEVGQNHQGSLEIAKKLIEAAKESGADCVKFQKTSINDKFNALALARPYESQHSWGQTYGEHKKFLEFSLEEFKHLQTYAEETVGIPFTSSAMDMSSLDFLDSLNVPFIKIGSGDANNLPMLKHAAAKMRPLIISTGMLNMTNVRKVYNSVKQINTNFCLLHCVSAYPTQPKEVNLNVLVTYLSEFPDVHIGYSGHELGTTISAAAVAMGAKILERHITLNKDWKGNDHACSLTPNEFKDLVDKIRLVETAMGSFVKEVQTGEMPCIEKLGKTVVAARSLNEGEVLDDENIIAKVAEPKGLAAQDMDMLYGKRTRRSIAADESIFYEDLF